MWFHSNFDGPDEPLEGEEKWLDFLPEFNAWLASLSEKAHYKHLLASLNHASNYQAVCSLNQDLWCCRSEQVRFQESQHAQTHRLVASSSLAKCSAIRQRMRSFISKALFRLKATSYQLWSGFCMAVGPFR